MKINKMVVMLLLVAGVSSQAKTLREEADEFVAFCKQAEEKEKESEKTKSELSSEEMKKITKKVDDVEAASVKNEQMTDAIKNALEAFFTNKVSPIQTTAENADYAVRAVMGALRGAKAERAGVPGDEGKN